MLECCVGAICGGLCDVVVFVGVFSRLVCVGNGVRGSARGSAFVCFMWVFIGVVCSVCRNGGFALVVEEAFVCGNAR